VLRACAQSNPISASRIRLAFFVFPTELRTNSHNSGAAQCAAPVCARNRTVHAFQLNDEVSQQ